MELEHVKRSTENVKKTSDGTTLLDTKIQEPPSPTGSTIEFDIGERGSIHKSSPRPISSANTSRMPQLNLLAASNRLQNLPHEPPSISPECSPSPPAVQTMGHPPGYDPNRIPSSVFSDNPTSASEWSITSNESLFSIQMGNNSFSRDYTILFGKSDELTTPEDWNCSQSNPFNRPGDFPRPEECNDAQLNPRSASSKSEESSNLPIALPLVVEVPQSPEQSRLSSGKQSNPEKKDENRSPAGAPEACVENHTKEKLIPALAVHPSVVSPKSPDAKRTPPKSPDAKNTLPAETTPPSPPTPSTPTIFPSPSRFSHESGNSGSSFAFPVLVNDGTKSATGSLKVVPEKPTEPQPQTRPPQQQPQPETTPPRKNTKEALNAVSWPRWRFCFPCWPRHG